MCLCLLHIHGNIPYQKVAKLSDLNTISVYFLHFSPISLFSPLVSQFSDYVSKSNSWISWEKVGLTLVVTVLWWCQIQLGRPCIVDHGILHASRGYNKLRCIGSPESLGVDGKVGCQGMFLLCLWMANLTSHSRMIFLKCLWIWHDSLQYHHDNNIVAGSIDQTTW